MRYVEDKQQSAELLRLALPLMTRQAAAFHPVSYSVWYEHVGGLNPSLSAALTPRLESNDPLTEEEVYRLYSRHISARDVESMEELQRRIHSLLDDSAAVVCAASERAGAYSQTLEHSHTKITAAGSLERVRYTINELLRETIEMRSAAQMLVHKLQVRGKEVSELATQLQQVQTEALTDPLCGIKNRRGFERGALAMSHPDEMLAGAALLIADVDHFKQINDTYGHLLGDQVLRRIAETIRSNVKGCDVAARIGGEEFAILLPQTSEPVAVALAERIRTAVGAGRLRSRNGQEVSGPITLSIGVAVAALGEDLEALIERADAALYSAKRGGRNRVCTAEVD